MSKEWNTLSPRSVSFNAARKPVEWNGRMMVGAMEGRRVRRGKRVERVRKDILSEDWDVNLMSMVKDNKFL